MIKLTKIEKKPYYYVLHFKTTKVLKVKVSEDILFKYKLLKPRDIDDNVFGSFQKDVRYENVYLYSLSLFRKNRFSESGLKDRLRQKGYTKPEVDNCIKRLKDKKYINDPLYYSEIVSELEGKNIGDLLINKTLKEKGINCQYKMVEKLRDSKISELVKAADKRYFEYPLKIKRIKVIKYLQQKGFKYEDIKEKYISSLTEIDPSVRKEMIIKIMNKYDDPIKAKSYLKKNGYLDDED